MQLFSCVDDAVHRLSDALLLFHLWMVRSFLVLGNLVAMKNESGIDGNTQSRISVIQGESLFAQAHPATA